MVATFVALAAFPVGAVVPQSPEINRASVQRVISVLADDGMEGRSAFSPAALRAAEFIASEFHRIGLDEV